MVGTPVKFSAKIFKVENGDVAMTLEKFVARVNRGIEKIKDKGVAEVTQKQMRESLNKQLRLQGKTSEFYKDLVEDYLYYWSLKKKLIKDIKDKGIRYSAKNGNGIEVEKANESVVNLQKTTATMLKILNDLNLKEPMHESDPENDYL